jgi:hypothetical protein
MLSPMVAIPRSAIVIKQLFIYSPAEQGDMVRIIPAAGDTFRPTIEETNTGIAIYPETPSGRDPLATLQAIDPLMKINQADAPSLPEKFHAKKIDHHSYR